MGPPRVVLLIMPYHLRGVILVEKIKDLTALWLQLIGLKPSSKCGKAVFMGINSTLYTIGSIGVDDNRLLVFKMNLKANNIGDMLLHGKEIETPHSLTVTDVACIQVLLNLILTSAKLHSGPVMALVDILVDVLDSLD